MKRKTSIASSRAASLARDLLPHASAAADFLRALANEQRLMILCNLADRELSVSELNACVALSQSALSQHLAVLRESALVRTRRDSQTVFYSLQPGPTLRIIAVLKAEFCATR